MGARCTVFLGPSRAPLPAKGIGTVICADSGYRAAREVGIVPHHLVGDMDSISERELAEARSMGVEMHVHPREKDRSDGELALSLAVGVGPEEIVILAGKSGRTDHLLSTFHLLYLVPEAIHAELWLDDDRAMLLREGSTGEFAGPSSVVSLVPARTDCVLSTEGLKYRLESGRIPFGSTLGIHNEPTLDRFRITVLKGDVYLVLSNSP